MTKTFNDSMLIITQPTGQGQSNYTLACKCNKEQMQSTLDRVMKTDRPKYIETETKAILVLTRALLSNSLVYFVALDDPSLNN